MRNFKQPTFNNWLLAFINSCLTLVDTLVDIVDARLVLGDSSHLQGSTIWMLMVVKDRQAMVNLPQSWLRR